MAFETSLTYIYGLFDPNTGIIRYVGKTLDLQTRFNLHLSTARCGGRKHKDRWILGLLNNNQKPTMIVLQTVNGDGDKEECTWISDLKASGIKLLNIEEGGSRAKNTPETRAKISHGNKGKKRSPEAIENYRKAARKRGNNRPAGTYKHSEKTRRKMSKSQKKVPMTPARLAALEKARAARRKKV